MLDFAKKTLWNIGFKFGRFITIHTRPAKVDGLPFIGSKNPIDESCAIIMQGPIKHEYNFTYETVRFYLQHYPSATIIISTWEGEDTSAIESLKAEKVKILKCAKPVHPGPCNVNMQITNTKAGMDEAVRLGLKYSLKTRADQRMYGINCLEFMINMIEQFPVLGPTSQNKRILATNTGTSKHRNYHFSDLFMFGTASDMQTYWTPEIITDKSINPRDFLAEGYLFTQFLTHTGWKIKDTLEDFIEALGERCVVVDNEDIDVYWPKYAAQQREYRLKNYVRPAIEITFKIWMNEGLVPALKKYGKK
jgi:hypothetical protein